jgi:hypothetical protein
VKVIKSVKKVARFAGNNLERSHAHFSSEDESREQRNFLLRRPVGSPAKGIWNFQVLFLRVLFQVRVEVMTLPHFWF